MCCWEGQNRNARFQVCSNFWSKKRKIKTLEEELKTMEENTDEVKTLIEELKAET
ncbi:hypothetical protein ACFL7M_04115 [Thermodesulfobacteriota bacterium]